MVKKRGPMLSEDGSGDSGAGPEQYPEKKKLGRPREIHYALEKKFTLMLPKDVHKALKIKSAELELPMTTLIIDAIKKMYLI